MCLTFLLRSTPDGEKKSEKAPLLKEKHCQRQCLKNTVTRSLFWTQVRSPSCVSDTPPGCRLTCCEGRNNIYARSHPGLSYKGDLVLCVGNKPRQLNHWTCIRGNNHLDADRRPSNSKPLASWHYERTEADRWCRHWGRSSLKQRADSLKPHSLLEQLALQK